MPLHIFEPRHRQLLIDVQSGPSPAGTLAEILGVAPYDDGASDLFTVGSRRFRIREVLTKDTPYLRARSRYCGGK